MTTRPNPDRRSFSSRERTALYLVADGRCELCGAELQPGWHGDHIIPYAAGGPTDVTNGQALCPSCNLKKGSTVTVTPRPWQRQFISKYFANSGPDFLCVACPGAGKTKAAGFVARDLIQQGEIDRIFIVAPNGPLRMQWHRALLELGLMVDGSTMNGSDHKNGPAVGEMERIDGTRVQGWVVTYHSLAMAPELHRILNSRRRTLAILDEVHHLGIGKSWGEAAEYALGPCVRRLSLSGTPFRGDGTRIPFVEYDADGWCRYADRDGEIYPRGFDYSYGTALSDSPAPVRSAVFEQFDGDTAWMEFGKDDPQEARISDPALTADIRRKVNRHVLNAAGEWLRDVAVNADRRLTMVREEGDTDAKGLIVCRDTDHAREVATILRKVAGPDQVGLAVSRDAHGDDSSEEARRTIERFGKSPMRWLVAVAMVSEGVDIPQLRVGVYATTVRAPLFFRQVLGRFVRWRNDIPVEVDQTAYLFIPKDPTMVSLADTVQEEVVQALLKENDAAGATTDMGDDEGPREPMLDFDSFLRSSSQAGGILLPGRGSVEHEIAERIANESGKPVSVVTDILASMARLGMDIPNRDRAAGATGVAVVEPVTADYTERIKAKKALLERNLKQVTGFILRTEGGQFSEIIAKLKTRVYSEAGIRDYRRADLPQLDVALTMARRLLESRR